VVVDETGEIRQPEDFAGLARPGYDGYRWDQALHRVVKDEASVANLQTEEGKHLPYQAK
jgi:hypothetical protein